MITIRQYFQKHPKNGIHNLLYDQWKCPGSTHSNQIKIKDIDTQTLVKEYGDFLYEGGYTTGFLPNGGMSSDIWADAPDERRFQYPDVVNKRESVHSLFLKAVENENDIEIYEENKEEDCFGYYDILEDYERFYYCNDTIETVSNRILLDPQVEKFVDKESLAYFLLHNLDKNALMCMENICFIYENEYETSKVRYRLQDKYGGDFTANTICNEAIGQLWVDRQTPIINISNLLKSSYSITTNPEELLDIFEKGILQTIFHECRHLLYECNELIPIGEGTEYPQDGGKENAVEQYGNKMADGLFYCFAANVIKENVLKNEFSDMLKNCGIDLEEELEQDEERDL